MDNKWLDKVLRAQEAGQLYIVPCKVGDSIFVIRPKIKRNYVKRLEVSGISINQDGLRFTCYDPTDYFVSVIIYEAELGKTSFFTHAEAAAALKKVKDDG